MSRVKIILRQAVAKLGDVGDVVSVTGGYARNYLIPRGMAVPATKGNVRQSETWRQSRAAREARELVEAEALKTKLEERPLVVGAQAGPDGRLFGSITSAHIAEALSASTGESFDRHTIELAEPIRHLGFHEVLVPLRGEVSARVTLEVIEQAP